MSKFDYPRLSRSDIITILAESQIAAVVDTDLRNPSPDFVSDIYTRLLIYLDLLHEEDMGQVDFEALQLLENPDHHTESVRTMKLYMRIREVLGLLDCPWKFTLNDLLRPQGDKTEKFLSAILNFCIHKDAKMELLRPTGEELTALDEQRREWEAKISELNAEIVKYNAAREEELPIVQELNAKVKELQQAITSLNSHQASLQASHRNLKERNKEIEGKISKAEFDLVQSVHDNANLRSKIVQSPDKLQRTLEEKKLVLEEAKNAERSAMHSFQEKTAILELYTKALKKMSKHLTQMQAIQEQSNSAKSIEKEYKTLKNKLSDDGVVDKSLDAKLVERQGKAQQLDDLKKTMEKERDLKCNVTANECHNIKLEVQSRRQDLEARQRKVEDVLSEVDGINSKTNLAKESGAATIQMLVRKSEEIVEQFHKNANDFRAHDAVLSVKEGC